MNEYILAVLLFGSAFALLISGIPIWAGLTAISIIFILIFLLIIPTIIFLAIILFFFIIFILKLNQK